MCNYKNELQIIENQNSSMDINFKRSKVIPVKFKKFVFIYL